MGASSKSPVDRPIRIEEERGERLIGVELEQREIEAVGRDHPHADKLIHEGANPWILVD